MMTYEPRSPGCHHEAILCTHVYDEIEFHFTLVILVVLEHEDICPLGPRLLDVPEDGRPIETRRVRVNGGHLGSDGSLFVRIRVGR